MKSFGIFIALFGVFGGVVSLSLCLMLWVEKPVGLPCDVTSYDGSLHIKNWLGTSEYLVNGGGDLLLASTRPHTVSPVGMDILKGLPDGSHLHVEF